MDFQTELEKKNELIARVREKMRKGIALTDPAEVAIYDTLFTEERIDDQVERQIRGRY